MMVSLEHFQGCVLGLALGDAIGAPYEGGILERALWRLIGTTKQGELRWTDDTQMSIDVLESLLARGKIDPDDLAIRFARNYQWSRGYGPAAARMLKRIRRGMDWRVANRSVYASGSYGNGAAMRAPIVGLFHIHRHTELVDGAALSGAVTHAHPLGIESAVLLATVTAHAAQGHKSLEVIQAGTAACTQDPFTSRLAIASQWLESRSDVSALDVIRQLGNGIAAHESCVTAVYLALRFREQPFLDMLKFIAGCGGDVDTIGAMAGAVWGAANGVSKLPAERLGKLEQRERLTSLATSLHQQVSESAIHEAESR